MSPLALLLVRDVVRLVRLRAPAVALAVTEARAEDSPGGRHITPEERWRLVRAVLVGVVELGQDAEEVDGATRAPGQ